MKLGPNIGEILLDIAQNAIQNGEPEKTIKTYTASLIGFSEELAIKLLKNEYVLVTSEDGTSVELTDWENEKAANRNNITDWNLWLKNRVSFMIETVSALNGIRDEFEKSTYGEDILDFDITKPVNEYFGAILAKQVGVHNIAAKLIAGDEFSELSSNGEDVWKDLCFKVEEEDDSAEKYQKILYFIVKYVNNIRTLHKEYMGFINSCSFLLKHGLADRPSFIEMNIESILNKLMEFANKSKGYYHPMCNTKLYGYKEKINNDILSTEYGKEYCGCGVIEKNIMDGYDAGWLSPDGKYYGENGPASSMIHLRIAEKLSGGDWTNGDKKLEEKGWVKIHGDEVYGAFIGKLTPEEDFPYQFCPTEIQIKMICNYIDKFHNGNLYTQPKIVEATEPISTYKLRQMDKFMLHNVFK